jgi:hypothetical protein
MQRREATVIDRPEPDHKPGVLTRQSTDSRLVPDREDAGLQDRSPNGEQFHWQRQLIGVAVAYDHACALPGRSLVCQPE